MLRQWAACLAHCARRISGRDARACHSRSASLFFGALQRVMITLSASEGGRIKKQKARAINSRGLTGLGCRYNVRHVSKEAKCVPLGCLVSARGGDSRRRKPKVSDFHQDGEQAPSTCIFRLSRQSRNIIERASITGSLFRPRRQHVPPS